MTKKKGNEEKEEVRKKGWKPAAVIVLLLLVAGAFVFVRVIKQQPGGIEFQKGMVYATWSPEGYMSENSDESMAKMRQDGTEWMSILVTWYQQNCWSAGIHKTETTPSDESIIYTIRKARELGMKVMLKPHLDLLDKSDGSWRGEIGSVKEPEWEAWFLEYTAFIMHYADIAQKEKVEILCIGTELSTSATTKGYMWKEMIGKIRKRYSGYLTYAAHWDAYQDIRFWDALDFVGINAYFPLTEKMIPTVDELREGWGKWVLEMEEFQERVGKPIIFPEVGCNSADGAAIRPWEHVPRTEVNIELQKNYYQVLLETFWDKDWFYGVYWWYWGTNMNMGGKYNRGFTPQNKPAEDVIREWYAKPVAKDASMFAKDAKKQ
ncbi:MAG: hypothetical protein ABIA77_03780 [Candidatus Omnitrophota bacterium]